MGDRRIVHVVDDDEAVREGVTILLEASGYDVEPHESGTSLLATLDDLSPGCILLDMHMPEISGLEVQAALRERGVHWPVIVLTGQGDVGIAVGAMKNGAFEFIEKPYQNHMLLETLRDAFEKLETLTEESAKVARATELIARLSQREYEIVQGLLAGLPNKIIAYELDLSVRTVEVYRANAMDKLQARGLSTAIRLALTAGVQPLEEKRGQG
jgi:two-component system response regulator FixJ